MYVYWVHLLRARELVQTDASENRGKHDALGTSLGCCRAGAVNFFGGLCRLTRARRTDLDCGFDSWIAPHVSSLAQDVTFESELKSMTDGETSSSLFT